MKLVVRADASLQMGAGHVMRCLALALAAKAREIDVHMICRLEVPWLQKRLSAERIPLTKLHGEPPVREKPAGLVRDVLCAAQGKKPAQCWVVLDGYHFDIDCQRAVRNAGFRLLVIDDYAHLPEYACDILLNQNLGAEELTYKGSIGKKLLGLRYVLLRPEFGAARLEAEKRTLPKSPQNVLITLGGGDFSKFLHELAPSLTSPQLRGRTLRIIAGGMSEEVIRQCLRDCPADIEILHNVRDMPALLLDTDVCITAGGSTCWELCCLGVPLHVVQVAENQHYVVRELVQKGLGTLYCGLDSVLEDEGSPQMRDRQMRFVHPNAADKLLTVMDALCGLEITPVSQDDCQQVLCIANDPAVRATAFSTASIAQEEHEYWFARRLTLPFSPFYIVRLRGEVLGYMRFDAEADCHIATVAVVPRYRDLGLGRELISRCCVLAANEGVGSVHAWIKEDNICSMRAFLAAGFCKKQATYYKGAMAVLCVWHAGLPC